MASKHETETAAALRSGVWYTAAAVIEKAVWVFGIAFLTRLLTKAEYGVYTNYTSWLSILTILATLNLECTLMSAVRDCKEKLDSYLLSLLGISTTLTGLWFILALVFRSQAEQIMQLDFKYILCMLVYLLFLPAVTLFRNRERFAYHYRRSVLAGTGTVLLSELTALLLVLCMPDRLTGRIVGSILPTMLVGTVLYGYFLRRGRKPEAAHVRYALPIALPYVPHLLSMIVLHSMDRIMITRLCGEEETALYSLAYNCGMMIALLQIPMNEAFSPWLAKRLAAGERQTVRQMSLPYFGVLAYGALGVMLVSPEILWVLGGAQYTEAQCVMPPITLGCVCQFAYMMLVNVEQYQKKTVGMALASVSAALLNGVLNLVCIPRYGYAAAAYTTLAGYLWLYAAHLFLVRRSGYGDVYRNRAILGVLAGLCAAAAGVTVLYSHTGVRYGVLAVYLGVTAFLVYRYRSTIQQILPVKSGRK